MANPTTNYGFVLPTSTDLVTDLPADFDVALQGVDTRLKALQPGTTLGDLMYASATANTNTRLGIGTTGQVLTVASGVPSWAAPAAAASGLTFITNSAFSAVTSHTITSCFTSTYSNYLCLLQVTAASADNNSVGMQLRASGTTTTTNYKTQRILGTGTTLAADLDPMGTDEFMLGQVDKDFPSFSVARIEIFQPQVAAPTSYLSNAWAYDVNPLNLLLAGGQSDSTQFDSMVIRSGSGTITGSMTIYGYQKS